MSQNSGVSRIMPTRYLSDILGRYEIILPEIVAQGR